MFVFSGHARRVNRRNESRDNLLTERNGRGNSSGSRSVPRRGTFVGKTRLPNVSSFLLMTFWRRVSFCLGARTFSLRTRRVSAAPRPG